MGPVLLVIISILSTYYAELYLSPGCSGYDPVKNVANVYVPSAVKIPSAWNISYTPVTTTDFLGHITTYPSPRQPRLRAHDQDLRASQFFA